MSQNLLDFLFFQGFFLKYIDKYKDICERLGQQIDEKENWQLLKSCLSYLQVIGSYILCLSLFSNFSI